MDAEARTEPRQMLVAPKPIRFPEQPKDSRTHIKNTLRCFLAENSPYK